VDAARAPEVQLQLDVAGPGAALRHHAWAGAQAVALLAQVHAELQQLMALPPPFLAGGLLRLTGVGPRRTGTRQPRALDEELLDDLFHEDALRRASAYSVAGLDRAWLLATADGRSERRLAAVEDPQGWWLVEPLVEPGGDATGPPGWQLVPTTPTVLWRRFTTVTTVPTTVTTTAASTPSAPPGSPGPG
jgi:hypothetical protein